MKLDQLRYFLETARHGHVGKAADVVAISPSAVSHSIAALEEELGRELFSKKGKNIVLTGHGKLLMEKAERLIREVDSLRDEMASDKVELQGHYKMAATHLLSSDFLAPAWTAIQEENPRLKGEIYSLRSAQVVAALTSGEYDFGLCFNPQPHPALSAVEVYSGQLVLAVARRHPLMKISPAEAVQKLSRYSATLPKAFQGIDNCESHPMYAKFGITPDIKFIFDSYAVAVENLASSQAWSLMPDWIVRKHKDRLGAIVPRGWSAPVFVSAIWPKNRLLSKPLKRLVSGLQGRFKDMRLSA